MDIVEKLLENIKVNADGCFNWQGSVNKRTGYGSIYILGKTKMAHRVSFDVFRKSIPRGMFVCHRCDNTSCINPAHLFLGTQQDNMRDAAKKNRSVHGERQRHAKLNQENVNDILKRYSSGEVVSALAKQFGVHSQTIRRVLLGQSWSRIVSRHEPLVVNPERSRSRGICHKWSKLNDDVVVEIRTAVAAGQSKADVAARFGVAATTVHDVVNRRTWKHV